MVSVPDILWRSRVPPWFIRTVKSEERPRCSDSANIISPPVVFWRLNKPVWKRHRVSAPFRHGSSGFASCVIWWSGFKQVGPGRWLLGNAAAPFLSVICWWNFSVFFYCWDAYIPKHWSTFEGRTEFSVRSQLDSDWKNTLAAFVLIFCRSSSQLSSNFSVCTVANSDFLYPSHMSFQPEAYIRSHPDQHGVNPELWPDHSLCRAQWDPPPSLSSGCWCISVPGLGANGTEAKVSWEEGLYAPQGSSSSSAFLRLAASVCVSTDHYVPLGGQWRLKRLDFGMRSHAVLFWLHTLWWSVQGILF